MAFFHWVTAPVIIYAVTAVCSWLTPLRLVADDGVQIVNMVPTHAFALTAAALAMVHGVLRLRGRAVVFAAAVWALATLSIVTIALGMKMGPAAWSAVVFGRSVLVAVAACGLGSLAWLVARKRSVKSPVAVRVLVALGFVLLAVCYAGLAFRGLHLLSPQAEDLDQLAAGMAGLTLDLWINSGILVFGAVTHVLLLRSARFRAA